MAWTHVRPLRESFALPKFARAAIAMYNSDRRSDFWFIGFILLQIVEFSLLNMRAALDVSLAACLAVSLIGCACVGARSRSPTRVTDTADPVRSETQAPTVEQTAPKAATCRVIALSEQSQTWADLMARISHEIRTPLNAVIGFSDLMERELFGPLGNPRYRDYAAHIKDSGDALLRSAEDTLALSSLLATPPDDRRVQTTSLSGLIRDAWFAIETTAHRRGITLEVSIPDKLDIAGNRRAFRQALSNMMQEALQRATLNTSIAITAQVHGGDTVWIEVSVAMTERNRYPDSPSTAICVARALLELQGTKLATRDSSVGSGWKASTLLDLTVQSDFFNRS